MFRGFSAARRQVEAPSLSEAGPPPFDVAASNLAEELQKRRRVSSALDDQFPGGSEAAPLVAPPAVVVAPRWACLFCCLKPQILPQQGYNTFQDLSLHGSVN